MTDVRPIIDASCIIPHVFNTNLRNAEIENRHSQQMHGAMMGPNDKWAPTNAKGDTIDRRS